MGIKIAVIAGLIATLAWAGMTGAVPAPPGPGPVSETNPVRVLLGLVILVQGFETSRYLGANYPAPERVRTMRWAQWLSTVIYAAFLGLATPFLIGHPPSAGQDTAIVGLLAPIGVVVGPLIIVMALSSQFSAGIADMNGAGGLISEVTYTKLPDKMGYVVTALVAIVVTWSADIFQIIVYASKAFALYYGIQTLLALVVIRDLREERTVARIGLFVLAEILALAVLVFGKAV